MHACIRYRQINESFTACMGALKHSTCSLAIGQGSTAGIVVVGFLSITQATWSCSEPGKFMACSTSGTM